MRLLLDTHLLLWAAAWPERLSRAAKRLISSAENQLFFSAASLWEVVIKAQLRRDDFEVDPQQLRRGLADNGYAELAVLGEHVIAVADLPAIHKDPFDRLLVAQARVEGLVLLTADERLKAYKGPVRVV